MFSPLILYLKVESYPILMCLGGLPTLDFLNQLIMVEIYCSPIPRKIPYLERSSPYVESWREKNG